MLEKHKMAPLDVEFVTGDTGSTTLRELLGKWVVLYFYPKDNTPGCTLEAEEFRDLKNKFSEKNAVILGVSKDSYESHTKFISKKQLTFKLVSDTDHKLMEAFGTWGERKFLGSKYYGTSRSTFLINEGGKVEHVWEDVKPSGHAKEVLETLSELQKNKD